MQAVTAPGPRLADCLKLIGAAPRELPDDHRGIYYLLANKHTHAFVSDLVQPTRGAAPAVRRWQLLADYTPEQVFAARVHGAAAAELIRDTVPRKDWPEALGELQHPLVRDTAGDRLRGWA